ncbi:MAG TPA: hypothetical protein VFY40_11030 [Blastocatellia bacterium]|nr:hypothetical protein [Blastocatellia bacterium]
MRIDQFIIKPFKIAILFAAIVILAVSLSPATATSNNAQDLNFRLLNIERKLDTVQLRVDAVERVVQSQALNNTGSSNVSTQALLELQQQQLLVSQQLLAMQKQMLELRKQVDQQALRGNDQRKDAEKKDEPKQDSKPKAQPKKP